VAPEVQAVVISMSVVTSDLRAVTLTSVEEFDDEEFRRRRLLSFLMYDPDAVSGDEF
jgi:hypothetical protein